ncbi:hypothetical protein [Streptomyces sp. NPDC048172]|uniref:hypothetical protein n=1 Tax=Streptomyces sp. NPDC048172 TaxID=3365505 RepID=UPI0037125087
MSHGRKALLRAVVPATVLALALTGCGSDDDSSDGGGKKGKSSSADKTEQGSQEKEQEEEAPSGPLTLGQPAPGTHEYDMSSGKAKLQITAQKVDKGANADLLAAGLKGKDVKGMYPVFVYFKYNVKSAQKLDQPDFNIKARVLGDDDKPGKKLIAIGASDIKGGCPADDDDKTWKAGMTDSLCTTFLLPEGTQPKQVAWAGDLRNPLLWNVK